MVGNFILGFWGFSGFMGGFWDIKLRGFVIFKSLRILVFVGNIIFWVYNINEVICMFFRLKFRFIVV